MIYAVGDLLTKGARIVLVPYYIAMFTKSELGELAILTAIGIAAWTLCTFGLNMAVQRQYFDYGDRGSEFVSSVWLARLIGGLPVLAILMLLATWYTSKVPLAPSYLLMLGVLLSGYLRAGVTIVEGWFIAREQPLHYRSFTFSQFLCSTLLIIFFVSGLGWGVAGVVLAELIVWVLWTLLSAVLLFRNALPVWRGIHWAEVVTHCAPAIPHAFFMWGLTGIDRLLLPRMNVSLADIGTYDIGYQLASYLSIITLSLRSAWLPKYFRAVSQNAEQGHREYGKTVDLFFKAILVAALAGFLLAPESVWLVELVSSKSSQEYVQVFRIVLIGYIGMAGFIAFNQPFLSERRIGPVALVSGVGLAINIVANLLLIPRLGVMGAAFATVIAYVAMSLMMFVSTQRRYSIAWEARGPIAFAVAALLLGGCAWWFGEAAFKWDFMVRLVCVAAFQIAALLSFPKVRARLLKLKNTQNSQVLPATEKSKATV